MHRLPVLLVLAALSSVASAVPLEFTHQGAVYNASGVPLDGTLPVVFSIYDDPAGTGSVWTETLDVDFDNGFFAVRLGTSTPIDPAEYDGDMLYMGIAIDGAPELPQRVALVSVPYALRAQDATNVSGGGIVDASEIRVNGSTVIDSSGSVSAPVDWADVQNVPTDITDPANPLEDLGCLTGQETVFDGLDWQCVDADDHEHDAADVTSGTFDIGRLPVGAGPSEVAAGDHLHGFGQLTGQVGFGQLPTGTGSSEVAVGSHAHAPGDAATLEGNAAAAFATSGHSHAAGDADTLDGADSTDFATSGHAHSYAFSDLSGSAAFGQLPVGTAANTVAEGDHGHTAADVGALPISGGTLTGSLGIGDTSDACGSAAVEGTLRWSSGRLEVCDGADWVGVRLSSNADGSSQAKAGRTCNVILSEFPTSADGLYWIDPDGDGNTSDAWQAWCDMTRNGGGWTLVMQNVAAVASSGRPTYAQTVNNVLVRGGTLSDNLAAFDLHVALSEWGDIGTQGRYEVGSTVGTPTKQAVFDSLTVNSGNEYQLSITGSTVTIGSGQPGIVSYHNGRRWTTVDNDNDGASGNCEANYHHPWWYNACWSGSLWGSNTGSHQPRTYWDGSGTDYHNWGALWLK